MVLGLFSKTPKHHYSKKADDTGIFRIYSGDWCLVGV
ncbi:MAG: hypothetical protein H6Q73_2142 [Firmicutes bacterium]|nr:hypothetical protein [Bacillota bacterium]